MPCWTGFGNLFDGRLFEIGKFSGSGKDELLLWNRSDQNYWLGQAVGGPLRWTFSGNTFDLGGAESFSPMWTGDFTGSAQDELLFWNPNDQNYWLGQFTGTQIKYTLAGNTTGFGGAESFSPVWTGDFTGTTKDELLFWNPNDQNYWLGQFTGAQINYTKAGNTTGFGGEESFSPVWTGDFTGTAKDELLLWNRSDQNLWLGQFTGTQIKYTLAGNSTGFGSPDMSLIWTGDFTGTAKDELLLWNPNDQNYWLGQFTGTQIKFTKAGNTAGFGGAENVSLIWTGDFTGDGHDELLFWYPGDQNYWLGQFTGTQIKYTLAGNTAGFGGAEYESITRVGDFTGDGHDELLFWYPGDGNWWLGRFAGNQLGYGLAGNTGRSHTSRIRLHFKVLSTPNSFTLTQALEAMRQVFSPAGIRVDLGSVEGLNLPALADLPVTTLGLPGVGGAVTPQQTQLFANRNNADPNDIVVYFVRSTNPPVNGAASFPTGRPGAVVTNSATRWTLAHEVGHVLGLPHIPGEHVGCPPAFPTCCSTPDFTRIMTGCGTNGITGTPTFIQSEITTMDTNALTVTCLPTEA